ncbi:MAG: cysteine hydrolase [Maribacter sp.]|nr:cysteine hydrolase [Maribacter sp.]
MKPYYLIIIPFIVLILGCKEKTKTENNKNSKVPDITSSSHNTNLIDKNIHIMAKPDSIAIDSARTAVIVVDMENDFGSVGGMFQRAGIDISMIQKVISPTSKVLEAARNAGITIIYLKMGYHDDLSDLGSEESPNRVRHLQFMHVGDTIKAPDGTKSRILIRNSWGTEIVPQLKPQKNDIVMYKTRFSGFYQTELDSLLKQMGKKYLIFTGCTTSICVESTLRDAMFRDYSSIVLEDCTAEPIGYGLPRSNHDASILSIQTLFGWVSTSQEFIKAVQKQRVDYGQKLQLKE